MAKVIKKEILVCDGCKEEVYTCDNCKEYFKEGDKISCYELEDGITEIHICDQCQYNPSNNCDKRKR